MSRRELKLSRREWIFTWRELKLSRRELKLSRREWIFTLRKLKMSRRELKMSRREFKLTRRSKKKSLPLKGFRGPLAKHRNFCENRTFRESV